MNHATLLGLPKSDVVSLAAAVRAGFSYRTLARFSKATDMTLAEVGAVIQMTDRTLVRRKAQGRLDALESDRLLRASRIFSLAIDLFEGDRDAAKRWLETPQRALGGAIPLQFAASDVGAREVENVIGRLEDGIVT